LNDPGAAEDWIYALADLSEPEIINGTRKAIDHTGYLNIGQFREMCKIEKPHASHRMYKALPHKGMEAEEMHKRRAKMKLEQGI